MRLFLLKMSRDGSRMEPKRILPVTVNLSIKNVPEKLAERLRLRAARSHRSLQGELMKILEEAVSGEPIADATEILEQVRALGLKTPTQAAEMIRDDRDGR